MNNKPYPARKIRCSHCYEKGHNRTTCPQLKKEAAADPNGYAARKLNRIKAKKQATVRRCSYCTLPGHTKRTCPQKPVDAEKLNQANRVWRSKLLESLQKAGLGQGALLQVTSERINYHMKEGDLLLIVDILWDRTAVDNSSWDYRAQKEISYSLINRVNTNNRLYNGQMICLVQRTGQKIPVFFPQVYNNDREELFYNSSRDCIEVLSPSDPTPPDDWLNCDNWAQKVM